MWFAIVRATIPPDHCHKCLESERERIIVVKAVRRGKIPKWYIPGKKYKTRKIVTLWYFGIQYHKSIDLVEKILEPYMNRWLNEEEFKDAMQKLLTEFGFSRKKWSKVLEFIAEPIEYEKPSKRRPRQKRCIAISTSDIAYMIFGDAEVVSQAYYYKPPYTYELRVLYKEFKDSIGILDEIKGVAVFIRPSCKEFEHLSSRELNTLREIYGAPYIKKLPKVREAIERILNSVRVVRTDELEPWVSFVYEYSQVVTAALAKGIYIPRLMDGWNVLGRLSYVYRDLLFSEVETNNFEDLKRKVIEIAEKLKPVIDELKRELIKRALLG